MKVNNKQLLKHQPEIGKFVNMQKKRRMPIIDNEYKLPENVKQRINERYVKSSVEAFCSFDENFCYTISKEINFKVDNLMDDFIRDEIIGSRLVAPDTLRLFNINKIAEAIKKQMSEKPMNCNGECMCECGNIVKTYQKYCYECGQKIDWSE